MTEQTPSPLGVGLAFNPPLADFVQRNADALDYIEISPERFWHDRGPALGRAPDRYQEIPEAVAQLDAARGALPILAHGVGLSIATQGPLDLGHVEQIKRWHDRYGFAWYSEHLAYSRLGPQDGWRGIGLMMPPVYDQAVMDDVAGKVRQIKDILDIDILLENAVDYTPVADADYEEADFLQGLAETARVHLLLDLHNLYTNEFNGGAKAASILDALDLTLVRELHIAGGELSGEHWLDSHSGRCPDAVWSMLEDVLSRPNGIQAVTFEVDESAATRMDPAALREELDHARAIWQAERHGVRPDVA
jgi:uncharacterized protein (UPF0276 family)